MAERFTINADPPPDLLRTLDERLDAFNVARTASDDARPIGLTLHDGGRLIGGLSGRTGFGWLYIDVLWLDQAYRRAGLGSRLLRRAEREAVGRGCRRAWLATFSFQALPFYLQHGYREFGRLDDYPRGETIYFLQKTLDDSGADGR